ncbi:MAG: class I SAM-dependent methyltransferase [Candidatus Solibacter sp.]
MQWFEDEHLWSELYPYVFSAARMASAAGQVAQILALTGITQGAVLDLCCGPGRHAAEFAALGFGVTGVDASTFLLQRARERSAEVEWVQADMRAFERPASFDLACNLFTSFGYFAHEEDNVRVLRNLFDNLRAGGTLAMDMVGREHMRQQGLEARHTRFADGAVLIQQPRVNADWTHLNNEWTVARADGSRRCYHFEHHLYSGDELQDVLEVCGFAEVRLYGDLAGAAYSPQAPRLVAIARKG